MQKATLFMMTNISTTFLTVELINSAIVLKPKESAGPYGLDQKSEHVLRLQRLGVLALSEIILGEPDAPKPKSRTTRTND